MPTIFSHAVAAIALSQGAPEKQRGVKLALLAIFCAVVPDADVLAFSFGIPYEHVLGHRGLTHSLLFAVVLGALVATICYRSIPAFSKPWWKLALLFCLATASHAMLDAFTDGGLGVAFFAPFDATRYFFPWRPIRVSPIGAAGFFSQRGWETIVSELRWIWLPAFFLLLATGVYRKRKP